MKGLCPFHDEKSPSFHVRPNHGHFHCFGCGEGGDVYTFLQKQEHVSFVEAVEQLADRIGYRIDYEVAARRSFVTAGPGRASSPRMPRRSAITPSNCGPRTLRPPATS